MKKIALFVCTVLCANVLMAQVQFIVGDLTYSVINSNEVEVVSCVDSVVAVNIPPTVTYNETTYTVTKITGGVNSVGCYIPAFYLKTRLEKITIPETVTTIGEEAFCYCEALELIDIPNSVVSLGDRAFYRCTSLRNVNIGTGLTYISEQCFQFCQNLTQINLGVNITEIRDYAFQSCYSLPSITFPESLTSLGSMVFTPCDSLQEIICLASLPPTIDSHTFRVGNPSQGISENAILKVPCSSLSAYASSEWNDDFVQIIEMCDGLGLEDEVAELEMISIYPNPTMDRVNFDRLIERIDVVDLSGKNIKSFENTNTINIGDLPKGIYYLKLYFNKNVIVRKVVKG